MWSTIADCAFAEMGMLLIGMFGNAITRRAVLEQSWYQSCWKDDGGGRISHELSNHPTHLPAMITGRES